jgi:acyl-CoA thioester hydrolase
MGERAAETMTASGMGASWWRGLATYVSAARACAGRTCRHSRPCCCEDGCEARHIYLCPMRWADMDSLGHVNNVTYVDYLQEARVDMLRVHAPATGGEQLAEATVVVRHEVEFHAPLVFRFEPVRIECWVTRVRAASFTMAYEILDLADDGARRVYTRARTVLTPFVFTEERPRRIRDEERAVLERFLEPSAA